LPTSVGRREERTGRHFSFAVSVLPLSSLPVAISLGSTQCLEGSAIARGELGSLHALSRQTEQKRHASLAWVPDTSPFVQEHSQRVNPPRAVPEPLPIREKANDLMTEWGEGGIAAEGDADGIAELKGHFADRGRLGGLEEVRDGGPRLGE